MPSKTVSRKFKLILTLSLLLVIGFVLTSSVSYEVSRLSLRSRIAENELPLTSDNVYSEIQRDLISPTLISSLMANDTFLRDWVIGGEEDEKQIAKYLKEIMVKYHAFTSFFVSEKTRIYYHANGILKQVKPDEERDDWYFRVREMQGDYETNVDPDMANRDEMTIFINHKVYDYDGQFIGAAGIGLTIESVRRLIDSYSFKYHRNIYFTDINGKIVLKNIGFPSDADNIKSINGLGSLADKILSTNSSSQKYTQDGKTVYLNTRFVPELNWYLMVEETEDLAIKNIQNAFFLNLLLCILITGIVILLTILTINTYERLGRKQQEEIVRQHEEIRDKSSVIEQVQQELSLITGLLPICAACKKIRDDQGQWQQIESYIQTHSEAQFSHSICPQCAEHLYPEIYPKEGEKGK